MPPRRRSVGMKRPANPKTVPGLAVCQRLGLAYIGPGKLAGTVWAYDAKEKCYRLVNLKYRTVIGGVRYNAVGEIIKPER